MTLGPEPESGPEPEPESEPSRKKRAVPTASAIVTYQVDHGATECVNNGLELCSENAKCVMKQSSDVIEGVTKRFTKPVCVCEPGFGHHPLDVYKCVPKKFGTKKDEREFLVVEKGELVKIIRTVVDVKDSHNLLIEN